jgi:phosphatidylglycerol lysyltransferase
MPHTLISTRRDSIILIVLHLERLSPRYANGQPVTTQESDSEPAADAAPPPQPDKADHGAGVWAVRLKRLAPLMALAVFAGCAYLLDRNLRTYSLAEIRREIALLPHTRLLAALGLTAANYFCLTIVDALAFRAARVDLPYRKIATVSLVSYPASFNFGALLGGASVRYRLFSLAGLPATAILKVMTYHSIATWMGLMTVASIAFLANAGAMVTNTHASTLLRVVGIIMAAMVLAYLAATLFLRRPLLGIRQIVFHAPPFRIAILQLIASATEIALAAAALWVLLPLELNIPFKILLAGFMLATFATIASQTPGGLGVFEFIVLSYAIPNDSAAAVGAVVVYRVIYYLGPLAVAAVSYLVFESKYEDSPVRRAASTAHRMLRPLSPLAPRLLAVLVFLCGVILLASGALPAVPSRLVQLAEWLPLQATEGGHLVGSVVGVLLLVLSHGIARRYDSAWWSTVALVVVGIGASLAKGFDWEEAAFLTIALGMLVASRGEFYRRGAMLHSRFSGRWWTSIALVIAASIWLGTFAYKEVAYSHDLWWSFAYHADASRFLRASLVAVVTLLVFAVSTLHGRPKVETEPPTTDDLDQAAKVIAGQGGTEGHLALMGDKSLLWNDDRTAFIMYAVRDASWIALGDPVGPEECHLELAWQYHELVDAHGGRTVFHHIPAKSLPIYLQLGLTPLKLGDAARVPLESFSLDGPKFKSFRQVRNRFEREGYEFRVVPAAETSALMPQLRRVSDSWLADKNTAEKRFSLGFFDQAYLRRLPVAVATKNGEVAAFANLLVTDAREELSIDLMRHVHDVPNGVMDYLFAQIMLWGKAEGYHSFSLGMAPLSGLDRHALAPLWNRVGNFLYEHGEHFYNYEGLRQYKQKFDPEWQPMYLCYAGSWSLPRIMLDFAALNSGGLRQIVAKG